MLVSVLAIAMVLVGAAGLLMLVVGLRGRFLNDHPICRKCGFDLVGIYPTQGRCPECGVAWTQRRTVRVGARARRRGLILAAVPMLLVASGGGGAAVWARSTNFNWFSAFPDWALEALASSSDRGWQDGAVKELGVRLTAGTLSGRRTDRLIEQALAAQADQRAAWPGRWSGFLDRALVADRMSRDQLLAFFEQGIVCEIVVPGGVRRHEPFALAIQVKPVRCGQAVTGSFGLPWPEMHLNGEAFIGADPAAGTDFWLSGSPDSMAYCFKPAVLDVEPGEHTVTTTVRVTVRLSVAGTHQAALPLTFTEVLEADVVVQPVGGRTAAE